MSLDPSTMVSGFKILSNELNNDMSFNTVLKPAKLVSISEDNAVVKCLMSYKIRY